MSAYPMSAYSLLEIIQQELGKVKFFGISGGNTEYWMAVDDFEKRCADERRENLDLNQIRAARYKDKSLQAASSITAESLPPSRDSADLHSLWPSFQAKLWMGSNLNPAGY